MSYRSMVCLICLFFPLALAQAKESESNSFEYRVLQNIKLQGNSQAVVMVKEGGHLLGQPFQVELRLNCTSTSLPEDQWPVADSFSVCDLSPESLKVNSSHTAVAMKTKLADVKHYDEQIAQGVLSPDLRCQKATTIKKFSLKHLCED